MTIFLLLFTLVLLFVGAISLVLRRDDSALESIVPMAIAAGCASMLIYILIAFRWSDSGFLDSVILNWQLPLAKFVAGIDRLSAFFMVPLLILSASGGLYGPKYFAAHHAERKHWFFYCALVAGMIMVLLSRNAVLFMLSWELMSISSFFLVITDTRSQETMRAGWIYLVSAHIGTAFLITLFFLLSSTSGSFDFGSWKQAGFAGAKADIIFILALIAFGLKAGFIPFHVWLPLAHPAAPSHVSALMSGIMIKMGIYGILRILTFIMPYHTWWGIALLGIGAVSGVLGVLFAIGQHDIKRLLAYHSVENIGIILLGLGLGIVGVSCNSVPVALLGFAGGLFHIINHSLFKALLFLGAGAVIRQTGTKEIDCLGGLIKKMPKTGLMFLIGATAICGLPFFNGFISELMIYSAGIEGAVASSRPMLSLLCMVSIVSLALIGGLAAACFIKVFSIVFLGEPRTPSACAKEDVPCPMLTGMGILAALCFSIGVGSPLVLPVLIGQLETFSGTSPITTDIKVLRALTISASIILGVCAVVAAIAAFIRDRVYRKRPVKSTVTWDCGYVLPDPSMQYTASSFAAPIVEYFGRPLAAHRDISKNIAYFPVDIWKFHSMVNDWFLTGIFEPAFRWCDRAFSSLRWFQSGKSGQYVLYILIAVLSLIVWKFYL